MNVRGQDLVALGDHREQKPGWRKRDRPGRMRAAGIWLSLLSISMLLAVAFAAPPASAAIEAPKILPAEVVGSTAVLHALLNPKTPAGEEGFYRFKLGQAGTCEEDEYVGLEPFLGTSAGEAVSASVEVSPAQSYTACVVAVDTSFSEFFSSELISFTVPALAPSIEQTRLVSETSTQVLLEAKIRAGGAATHYQLELVTQQGFEREGWAHAETFPSSPSPLPSGSEPVSVTVTAPVGAGATYEARFTASNGVPLPGGGTRTEGPAIKFEIPPLASAQLPDNRAYELVTPAPSAEPYMPEIPIGSHNASAFLSSFPIQAAANGESLAYVGEAPAQGGNGFIGDGRGNAWVSVRSATGWRPAAIQPESNEAIYEAFSQDLTEGFLEGGETPVIEGASGECKSLYATSIQSRPVVFSPLFTGADCGRPLYAGTDVSKTTFIQDEAALTANTLPTSPAQSVWFVGKGCTEQCNLYESSGGKLSVVNELNGQPVPSANFGGYAGGNPPDFSHVVSTDGSRVFWTDTQAGEDFGHIFVRMDKTRSVPVSLGEAEYATATSDGRFAYYIEGGVLWRFDTGTSQRTPITPEAFPEGGEALGVVGVNEEGEDGAYVYYVDGSVLTEAQNGHGDSAQPGQPNLYVNHGGKIVYIATLSHEDEEIRVGHEGVFGGDWQPNVGLRTAELTPDGKDLIFESHRSLTGYENEVEGSPIFEVFRYDAGTAALACASCAPSGLPPGPEVSGEGSDTLLPVSWLSDVSMRRWLSSDGTRVFFDSTAALVGTATNHLQGVYEWEAEGTSGCPVLSQPRANDGCVFLLSSGSTANIATFVEADETGSNVFFEQRGSLGSVSGVSGADEIYDARVDGGIASPVAGCAHGDCSSSVQPPAQAPGVGIATSELSGLGNFAPQAAPAPAASKPTRKQLLAKALKKCQRAHRRSARLRCRRSATKKYGGRSR